MKNFLNTFAYAAICTFFRVSGCVPLNIARRWGHAIGRIWYGLDKKHRNVARNNLKRAFGKEKTSREIHMLAKNVFCQLGQILFEIGWSLNLKPGQYRRYFTVEGMDHLRAAHARGKGVLILTGHMGNWELLPIVSDMINFPVSIVFRPLDFEPLNRFFIYLRSRFGDEMISRKNALPKIYRNLSKGRLIALLMDQKVGWTKGCFVEFFGHRACTHKSLAFLAMKTGAPVVPLFLIRTPFGFKAAFGPEIPFIRTGDTIRDIEDNTQRYNDAIENTVRAHPEQWFWVHRRWQTKTSSRWPRNK